MDERDKNIRLVKDNSLKNSMPVTGERQGREVLKRKVDYQKRQKERRYKKKRRRTALLFVLCVVLVCITLFLTPIFNIRSISVDGNRIVTNEQITEILKPLVGENLLRTGSGKITKMIKKLNFIESVDVQKKLFPPSVEITVTEYTPTASIRIQGKNLIINRDMLVLSDSDDILKFDVPVITGIEVKSYKLGKPITAEHEEKGNTLHEILKAMDSSAITDKVVEINLSEISNIHLNYDDRLTVNCGSSLDIDRKIRLLAATLRSASLPEDAKGTIDMSETGKAVFTP